MHAEVLDTSLRDAAELVGLGHEALRKFIHGITDKPHERSRRSMGMLYLKRRAGLGEVQTAPTAGQIKLLFARGLDAATAQARETFAALREGRTPPVSTEELEKWIVRRLREEYAAETSWTAPKRKRSRK
jgi:hypothetical protein